MLRLLNFVAKKNEINPMKIPQVHFQQYFNSCKKNYTNTSELVS